MARAKNTSKDDQREWLEQIRRGEFATSEQAQVHADIQTIIDVLQERLEEIDARMARDNRLAIPFDPALFDKLAQATSERAKVMSAQNAVFALLSGSAHPVADYISIARSIKGGRPPASYAESMFRALCAAYTRALRNRLPRMNLKRSSEAVAQILANLGETAISAETIRTYESNPNNFSWAGMAAVNNFEHEFNEEPEETLEALFAFRAASIRGGVVMENYLNILRRNIENGKKGGGSSH